jgi:hypothetical protein
MKFRDSSWLRDTIGIKIHQYLIGRVDLCRDVQAWILSNIRFSYLHLSPTCPLWHSDLWKARYSGIIVAQTAVVVPVEGI